MNRFGVAARIGLSGVGRFQRFGIAAHSDINISDSNVEWKDLVDLEEGTDDFKAAWRNERFFEFPDGTQSVRYLRLVIPDVSYVNEQEKNQALGRRQALSEFGTFYYK